MSTYRLPEGKDFLSHILCPLIAVLSSSDADELALENNLLNFTQFIAPFGSRIQGRGGGLRVLCLYSNCTVTVYCKVTVKITPQFK